MFKAELHCHVFPDPQDELVKHSPEQLFEKLSSLGYKIVAITPHLKPMYSVELAKLAQSKGLFLIPSVEAKIEGKDVLLYNFTNEQIGSIKNFDDLRALKSKDNLVIAPHPFFPDRASLLFKFFKNIDVFDAVEYSHFYNRLINFNIPAVLFCKKKHLPVIGTGDSHELWQTDLTYSLIDCELNVDSFVCAVKSGNVKIVSRPLTFKEILKGLNMMFNPFHIKGRK